MVVPTRTRATVVERRAAFYLWLYERMPTPRSLARLTEFVGAMSVPGLKITLRTLERYSREYRWQEAVETFDEEVAQRRRGLLVEDAIVRAADDAELVSLMKDAGRYALELKTGDADADGPVEPLADAPAVRAVVDGIKLGRLISGEATEIQQVMVSVYDNVGRAVSDIFLDALSAFEQGVTGHVEDPEAVRAARNEATGIWGRRLNAVIVEHFRVIGVTELEVG